MSEQTESQEPPREVECRAAKDPAVRLFILAAILIGWGVYCYVDHYVRGKYPYPGKGGDPNDWAGYIHNAYGPFLFIPVGVFLALWSGVFLRRKLRADGEGIGYLGREKILWSDVTSLDSARLADKGILYLHHKGPGGPKRLKLDRWKLQNFRELVRLLETKVPRGRGD
jgi:hypothetical protein